MVSSGSVPWAWRPARPFPALVWLEQRFPFRVAPARFARQAEQAAEGTGRRPFPAKVWLEERRRASEQ